jgi:uncharacterized membrane protein
MIPAVFAAVFGDTMFDVLKSAHVLLAALWVGSGFALNVATNLAFASRDPVRESMALQLAETIGQRLLTPISLGAAAAGVWLVLRYDNVYDFGDFWVSYGLGFFVLTSITGAGFLGPTAGKMARQITEGADQEAVLRTARPFRLVAAIDLLLLSSVIVVMVVKPT